MSSCSMNSKIKNSINSNKFKELWKLVFTGKHQLDESITKQKLLGLVNNVLWLNIYHYQVIDIVRKDDWIELLNKLIGGGPMNEFNCDIDRKLERLKTFLTDYNEVVEDIKKDVESGGLLDVDLPFEPLKGGSSPGASRRTNNIPKFGGNKNTGGNNKDVNDTGIDPDTDIKKINK